jgi:hypothetical protein
MRHGDLVYVDDPHPEFGYKGPARFVRHIQQSDKDTGWSGYVYLLDLEPHCAVKVKGDELASIFPTRCVQPAKGL